MKKKNKIKQNTLKLKVTQIEYQEELLKNFEEILKFHSNLNKEMEGLFNNNFNKIKKKLDINLKIYFNNIEKNLIYSEKYLNERKEQEKKLENRKLEQDKFIIQSRIEYKKLLSQLPCFNLFIEKKMMEIICSFAVYYVLNIIRKKKIYNNRINHLEKIQLN